MTSSPGDIFRGDLEDQTAELFIDAPDGRVAVGMFADLRHDLLFVAGGFTGQAYVYDLDSGETVATYQFAPPSSADADPPTTVINDVTVTEDGAWFTDSRRGVLFFVPIDDERRAGRLRHPRAGGAGRRHQRRLQPERHRGHPARTAR